MSHDAIIRTAAVVAAVALLAAPYRAVAAGWLAQAAEAAKRHRAVAGRVIAAALLIAAAWGKVPLPKLPAVPVPAPSVTVETPSVEMQAIVEDVAAAMRSFNAVDRAAWAETWTKAAIVVASDGVTPEVAFSDTRSLRAYTALALDIAWRRIGGKTPGTNEDLRVAVEAAYAKAMGVAIVSVTKETRDRYAEFARAMAWAGMNKG